MILDGERVVAQRLGVPAEKLGEVTAELHHTTGPGFRVEIAEMRTPPNFKDLMSKLATRPAPEELKTAELANHMLWESFARSCEVQSFMLERMTGCAVEMNRRFVEELETMRGNYTKALEKIDGMQFEQRMLEHEAASRRLSNHYVRMAEEDHRAAERRRSDDQSVLEQLARGVMRVVDMLGSDSINGKD